MADPLCHATQGGLLLLAPFVCRIRRAVWIWVLGGAGGILSALPDLIGVYGFIVMRDHGRLYNNAHFGSIKDVIQYIPMTWLHFFFDSYMHDPERTWQGIYLRNSLELFLWLVNIGVIAWMVRLYRRNRALSGPRAVVHRNRSTASRAPLDGEGEMGG